MTGIHGPTTRGSFVRSTKGGDAVQYRPNGRVSDIHIPGRGIDIHQGLNGGRTAMVMRPDHSQIFVQKGRPGWLQRPYNFNGHDFQRRTMVYRGHVFDNYYRGYMYRGLNMNVYAPAAFFGMALYGWAFHNWGSPSRYQWDWLSSPWYRYYGYYFSPFDQYQAAPNWLTDYMMAQDLQTAYGAQQAGEMNGDPSQGAAPLTPEVKQMIADEVRNQLALENQEAQQNQQQAEINPGSSGIARMIADVTAGHPRVFVVGTALDVVNGAGMECSLSDGDTLQMQTPPPADATAAQLTVLSSKGGKECRGADAVQVQLTDLQEMQNQMRATLDQGLQQLQTLQGKGGIPAMPPAVAAAAVQTQPATYATMAPPADPNAANEVQQQAAQASQAESQVTSSVNQSGSATPPIDPATGLPLPVDANGQPIQQPAQTDQYGQPVQQPQGTTPQTPTITLGQSTADVEAIMGQPNAKANLGNKVIYNYSGLKVTFVNGQVTDVQ